MSIRSCFNRAAGSYDENCHLQLQVGNTLIARLKAYSISPATLLDVGCGTGLVTALLLLAYPDANWQAIDISEDLLTLAKKRLRADAQLKKIDFDNIGTLRTTFDLIFGNMALHWSQDLAKSIAAIRESLNPGGYFAFSLPVAGTFNELQPPFRKMDFHDPEVIVAMLKKEKFDILSYNIEKIYISFDSAISALRSIKKVGANYTTGAPPKQFIGKSFLRSLAFTSLAYQIGYFIVRKPL
ncbi:MAG TPA: methyltransferase domain-containing protein [Gammaproteobacteria bacterium]|jgi:malonyl-CoA O-methyltransferase|nr:methyltransferase domain-containing protein [Gammaproteobacteria bacterium]